MNPLIGSALIGAAGSLGGNLLSMFGGQNANAMSMSAMQQQMMQQQGFVDAQRRDNWDMFDRNYQLQLAAMGQQAQENRFAEEFQRDMFSKSAALQREFASHGIRWRMEDAAAAGIHPVFAMGAGGAAFAPPQAVGGGNQISASPVPGGSSGGGSPGVPSFSNPMSGFQGLGQDLSRAVAATMTARERQSDQINFMELQRHQWAKESHDMNMALMASRLALVNQQTGRGGFPGSEKGGSMSGTGLIEKEPLKVAVGKDPNSPSVGPGQPGTEWRVVGGGLAAFPHRDLNIDEFSSPGYSSWMIPNKVEPFFERNPAMKPPPEVFKKAWPNAVDVVHHFGSWYPKYAGDYFPPFTGLRNSPDDSPITRPGKVRGMFIDRRY